MTRMSGKAMDRATPTDGRCGVVNTVEELFPITVSSGQIHFAGVLQFTGFLSKMLRTRDIHFASFTKL